MLTQGEGDLLLHLSALDKACCNHAIESLFATVARRVTFTAGNSLMIPEGRVVKNLLLFMCWIYLRQIAVKTLFPTSENIPDLEKCASANVMPPFRLPSVLCLQLDMNLDQVQHEWLVLLLKKCPNLTHFESSAYSYESKEFIWMALEVSDLPELRKLVVPTHDLRSSEAMLAVLAKFRAQLEELHIPGKFFGNGVAGTLASQPCLRLRVLSCGPTSLPTDAAELLFKSCSQLTILTMNTEVEGLHTTLDAGKHQLKQLRIFTIPRFKVFGLDDFAGMLERYPLLEELAVDDFEYCRLGQMSLDFRGRQELPKLADLDRVLSACTVKKLRLAGIDDFAGDTSALSWLESDTSQLEYQYLHIGNNLFEVLSTHRPLSSIRQLTLHDMPSCATIDKITTSCPRLRKLGWILSDNAQPLTPPQLKFLLAGCPELTELCGQCFQANIMM